VSAGITILIVLILIVVAVAAAVVSMRMRRRAADRNLVGPEYDRLADEIGPRKAKAEFEKRRQRVHGLGIRSLSAARRTAYAGQWDAAQEQFVDSPVQAVWMTTRGGANSGNTSTCIRGRTVTPSTIMATAAATTR